MIVAMVVVATSAIAGIAGYRRVPLSVSAWPGRPLALRLPARLIAADRATTVAVIKPRKIY